MSSVCFFEGLMSDFEYQISHLMLILHLRLKFDIASGISIFGLDSFVFILYPV